MWKKARLVWLKKLWGVGQVAHLKQQRFLYLTFYKIQRSYKKIVCICYFIGSVVKTVLYLHFLYAKDGRLLQIKKKHEWWNNRFSDVSAVCLNLKNFRNSRPDMFYEKGVLRDFVKFTGKHLGQSLFFNKVACLGLGLQLY